jgi:hypothetical protein
MLNIDFTNACTPAPEEALADTERKLEVRIPKDYREFLLEVCNGGRPDDNVFEQGEVSTGIASFFGVGRPEDDEDVIKVYEVYKDRVPSWLLPVADTDEGNLICISIRQEDEGAVYLWDHELEAQEGEPPTEENLTRVAYSFRAFTSAIRPTADEEMPPDMEVKRAWVNPAFLEKLNKGEGQGA